MQAESGAPTEGSNDPKSREPAVRCTPGARRVCVGVHVGE